MCAAVGGVKLADQGGFTRLHQNGGRHYLGPDCKHARSPTSCLGTGAKPNRQVGHFQTQSRLFASDLKVADRTKKTLTKNTCGKSHRLSAGCVGTFHSATGPTERVINNRRDLDDLSEVQGLDPFMPFRQAWASSPRMCST